MSLHIVFFMYGLAFFLFGFSIFVYPKRETGVALALDIQLLATFGVLHGINEWVDMLLMDIPPGEELHYSLMVLRTVTIVTSFLCLLVYGVRVVAFMKNISRWIYVVPVVLLAAWTGLVVTAGDGFFTRADVLTRYLLALPGIALTAYALRLNIPEARGKGGAGVEYHLMLVIGAFVCYGFFAGMVVPETDFFPASVLNYRTFTDTVGMPVQILRALCAVVAAYGILWVLRVFTWRTRSQLELSRLVLEQKVDERTFELRSLNEELEQEMSEKVEYERELVASLREKEALLSELHHRVKNNMQIMVSLLRIENRLIDDPTFARMFTESTNRLNTMITIQERLYSAESFGPVELAPFLQDLTRTVFRMYSVDANRIRLVTDVDGLSLSPDTIVPLGMVLHELMSNSIVHGFSEGRQGQIHVALNHLEGNMYELRFHDTGVGLPEGFDIENTATLGMELVKLLSSGQLGGSVEAFNDSGAVFTVRFRELKYRERL